MAALLPGAFFDERYQIVHVLGVGAFGTVYKARQTQFDRMVAVKTLNTNMLEEPDGMARFEREAKAIDSLKHTNIISVYGFGVWNGAPYMVTEFAEGQSLEKLIARETRLSAQRSIAIMRQVLDGLQCAHNQGLVHRDLKPSNVMLVTDAGGKESVKIIDFGLVKLLPGYGIPSQKLTETGYALGTCHYMSPEQCLGGQIDQRADIYAAGCMLYQCLTGDIPFDARESIAVMYQHLNETPKLLSDVLSRNAEVDALQIFLHNCLAKEAADRYASADVAGQDLTAIAEGRYKDVCALSIPQRTSRLSKRQSGSGFRTIGLAVLAIAAVVGIGFSIAQQRNGHSGRSSDGQSSALAYLFNDLDVPLYGAPSDHKMDHYTDEIHRALFAARGTPLEHDADYQRLCTFMVRYYIHKGKLGTAETYARMGDQPTVGPNQMHRTYCHGMLTGILADDGRFEDIEKSFNDAFTTKDAVLREKAIQNCVLDYAQVRRLNRAEAFLSKLSNAGILTPNEQRLAFYLSGNLAFVDNRIGKAKEYYRAAAAAGHDLAAVRLAILEGKFQDALNYIAAHPKLRQSILKVQLAAELHDSKLVSEYVDEVCASNVRNGELPAIMDYLDENACLANLGKPGYEDSAKKMRAWLAKSH